MTATDVWRIAIVDDADDLRALLRHLLTRDGRFQVVGEASDGATAIEVAVRARPHAMILDLAMPVMDGFQALPEILAASPDTRVLVLSGFDEDQVGAQALSLGAHAYLEKGAAFERLVDVLAELCDHAAAR